MKNNKFDHLNPDNGFNVFEANSAERAAALHRLHQRLTEFTGILDDLQTTIWFNNRNLKFGVLFLAIAIVLHLYYVYCLTQRYNILIQVITGVAIVLNAINVIRGIKFSKLLNKEKETAFNNKVICQDLIRDVKYGRITVEQIKQFGKK